MISGRDVRRPAARPAGIDLSSADARYAGAFRCRRLHDRAGADLSDLAIPRSGRGGDRNLRVGAIVAGHPTSLPRAMRAVASWRVALRAPAENPLVTVRLGTKAVAARQNADGVELDVTLPDGGSETIQGTFLVGADGIGSIVRQAIGASSMELPSRSFSSRCPPPTIFGRRCPISPTFLICRIRGSGTC